MAQRILQIRALQRQCWRIYPDLELEPPRIGLVPQHVVRSVMWMPPQSLECDSEYIQLNARTTYRRHRCEPAFHPGTCESCQHPFAQVVNEKHTVRALDNIPPFAPNKDLRFVSKLSLYGKDPPTSIGDAVNLGCVSVQLERAVYTIQINRTRTHIKPERGAGLGITYQPLPSRLEFPAVTTIWAEEFNQPRPESLGSMLRWVGRRRTKVPLEFERKS